MINIDWIEKVAWTAVDAKIQNTLTKEIHSPARCLVLNLTKLCLDSTFIYTIVNSWSTGNEFNFTLFTGTIFLESLFSNSEIFCYYRRRIR